MVNHQSVIFIGSVNKLLGSYGKIQSNVIYMMFRLNRKLHVSEQAICNLYNIHSDSEQYATVGVLRDLINCRDGIYVIDYFNHDDITGIIDVLLFIINKCMCSRCRRDDIHVCFANASPQCMPHMYNH